MINKEVDGVIKAQIRSRHTTSKTYNLWIEHNSGINPTTGWYCTCKSGARVVGYCAQIPSVIWYLGFQQHQPNTKYPKTHDTFMKALTDAADEVWDTDTDS